MKTDQIHLTDLSPEAQYIAYRYSSWAPTYNRMLEGEDSSTYTAADVVARTSLELAEPEAVSSILDLATGTGAVVKQLRGTFKNAKATGLDISQSMMDQARLSGARVQTLLCDIERMNWPVENRSIDLVTCAGALSLVGNLDHVLSETSRTLKPGGLGVMSYLIAHFSKGMGAMEVDDGSHIRTYTRTPFEMQQNVENHGFTVVKSIDSFVGFRGLSFAENHGVIAFTR